MYWLIVLVLTTIAHIEAVAEDDKTDDKQAGDVIELVEGKIFLTSPSTWKQVTPKFKAIVDYEFEVPAAEDKADDGRVTVGGANKVDEVFAYWKAQYVQPDRIATSERSTINEIKVAGQVVHLIDITGTYRGNEYRKEPSQPNARLLGAIIVTDKLGRYFVKLYGPNTTVAANEEAFMKMVQSLEVK